MTISKSVFIRILTVGVIATYIMTMTGFWIGGLGLPPIDVGAMLAENMTSVHPENPYGLIEGNLAHFMNGVLLTLVWVSFLQQRIPGNWFVHGIIYGVLTSLAANLVAVPLLSGAGVFFTNAPNTTALVTSSVLIHFAFSFSVTLGLKILGVGEKSEGIEIYSLEEVRHRKNNVGNKKIAA